MEIKIRAHHLLCIPRFKGGGYNKNIRERIFEIQKRIKENPNIKIKVVKECDNICDACPFKKDNICKKTPKLNYWILVQDNKVLKKLNIKNNQTFKAKNIFKLSIVKIKNKELKNICKRCNFLDFCLKYGLNKSFVSKIK